MPIYFVVLLDLLILYFFFGNQLRRLLLPPARRRRAQLKDFERHFRNYLHRELDLLTPEQQQKLQGLLAEIRQTRVHGDNAAVAAHLSDLHRSHAGEYLPPPRRHAWIREHFEVIVVALGVAFGIRALFLQPFKIPTGSMQPTLYGIHFTELETPPARRQPAKAFNYLNFSQRPIDIVAANTGPLELSDLQPLPSPPFFPSSEVQLGQQRYSVPGTPDTVMRTIYEKYAGKRDTNIFVRGEIFLRGYLELGDHLFVNRLSLCFSKPRRGDVMVFVTDNLPDTDGQGFGGRYYIKRLVGMPGDTLKITDHRLYVKPEGETDFRLLDASDNPGFARMHSFQGGFRGYAHMPNANYLTHNDDTFTIPAGEYFMLGDNSENSKDSRYWGTVPRRNLVGTACFVWWPFSRRWGPVDRVAPLPVDTPPTFAAVNDKPH